MTIFDNEYERMKRAICNVGYYKIENWLNESEINDLKSVVKEIQNGYNLSHVRSRTYYKRELGKNRQGDACMYSLLKSTLPSLIPTNTATRKLLQLNNTILSTLTGVDVEQSSRTMFNAQQYFEESFEVADHYDGEFFDFIHDKNVMHDEVLLKVKRGLIPRYVVVVILENDNFGKGTYLREHNSKERIEVSGFPGDLIIFDNIRFRHGVPKLQSPRLMIGMRNFDHSPFYFESSPEGGNGWIELQDEYNPGWIREYSNKEAKEEMIKFNNLWMDRTFNDYVNKDAAF